MYTKLTLRIEKDIIDKIKLFAMTNQQSVSSLTENLYKEIIETESPEKMELSPIVRKYKGIIKNNDINDREEITKYLTKKHK
ncbi:MAG: hypothetical protein JW841_10815 [Deltaproteobacteria bacterium]|nr:hypothetical protein [Deltaproteobacteria bacterium]